MGKYRFLRFDPNGAPIYKHAVHRNTFLRKNQTDDYWVVSKPKILKSLFICNVFKLPDSFAQLQLNVDGLLMGFSVSSSPK